MISITSWMEDEVSKEQCRLWQRKKVWTLSLLAKSWRLFKSLFRRHLANLWQVAFSRATKQRQVVNVAVVLHDPLRRDLYSRYLLSASAVHQSPRGFVSRMAPPDDAGGLRPAPASAEDVPQRFHDEPKGNGTSQMFHTSNILRLKFSVFIGLFLGRGNICTLNHSVRFTVSTGCSWS